MTKTITTIEGFDGAVLHPSLDIRDDILVLGFRYTSKSREDEDLILMVWRGNIEVLSKNSLTVEGKEYSVEKRGRKLMRVQERWGLDDLKRFVEEYADLKAGIVPEPNVLFEEIKTILKRYVELEKEPDYSLVAAWILGTYFHPAFSAYPFLNVKAPKRSGKSQLLGLLRQLCFNAVKARPTVAALSDTVDALRGTYLIDQADGLGRPGTEELLDILADSYKRSGGKRRLSRIDKGKRYVDEFDTYSPKAFASIRELPEDLRDRCYIVPLLRSTRNFLDPDEESDQWQAMRGKIYKFLLKHYSNIASTYNTQKIVYKQKPDVVGRTLELWLPFETMLLCVGAEGELEEAQKRFLGQYGFAEYEPSELEETIVKTILDQFEVETASEITLSPKEISERVDATCFRATDTPAQMAAKVGWAIKKFNLASQKTRSSKGHSYRFEKEKVDKAYRSYFSVSEPTQPAQAPEGLENTVPDEVQVSDAGVEPCREDLHDDEPTPQTYTENSPEFAGEKQEL